MSGELVRVGEPGALAGHTSIALPRLIVDAGPAAAERFLEFFAAQIANDQTRAAYRGRRGSFSRGARPAASGCARSRRSTSPPTSGPIAARCRR